MGPFELTVLEVLRTHADRLTWLTIQDRQWAKVLLDHVRNDESLSAPEFEGSFDNSLDFLEGRGLYRKDDEDHGWVDMGEIPPPDEATRIG
jgi:hypothetical protein